MKSSNVQSSKTLLLSLFKYSLFFHVNACANVELIRKRGKENGQKNLQINLAKTFLYAIIQGSMFMPKSGRSCGLKGR